MATTSATPVTVRQSTGRLYLWLGIGLALLGPVLYLLQVQLRLLTVPWYAPLMATLGVAMVLFALARRWSWWRLLGLVFCGLLAGAEWYFLLSLSKLPAYAGPVAAGRPFPPFAVARADGSPFTQADLTGDQKTILLFFRGRW